MSKSRERAFYLTISVFALALTAAAAVAVVRNVHGTSLDNWLKSKRPVAQFIQHPVNQISTPPQHPVKGQHQPAKGIVSNLTGNQASVKPNIHPSTMVEVVPYGHRVTTEQLNHTRQLLAQYQVAAWDGKRLQMTLNKPVKIELAADKTDYQAALQSLGVDQASSLTQDTTGFTLNNTIVIPLYQNTGDPDLLNSLAHELTHAYFNENGLNLPSWLDEGMAVNDGMSMQQQAESRVAYMGYAKGMAEDVMKAAQNDHLQPLSADESAVLSDSTTYDVELQDWLAVRMLLQQSGYGTFRHYFSLLKQGEDDSQAFTQAFGRTDTTVSESLKNLLTQAVNAGDHGVQLSFDVHSSASGSMHVLPRNSQIWQGFQVPQGSIQFGLQTNGTLTGLNQTLTRSKDTEAPDEQTVYIDMQPNGNVRYQGHQVSNWGYAIDVHYGLYGFLNSWVSLSNGKTVYLDTPSVLGVNLTGVQEMGSENPIMPILLRDPLS